MVDVLPLLSERPEMVFRGDLSGLAGFEGWYQRVIRIFFDEIHEVKMVSAIVNGDEQGESHRGVEREHLAPPKPPANAFTWMPIRTGSCGGIRPAAS